MKLTMMLLIIPMMTPLCSRADLTQSAADCLQDHSIANLPLIQLDENQQQQAVQCLTLATKQTTGW